MQGAIFWLTVLEVEVEMFREHADQHRGEVKCVEQNMMCEM